MTRSASQAGDTQVPPVARPGQKAASEAGRGPWSAPGPAATWWHGDGSPTDDAKPEPAPTAEPEPTPAAEPEPAPAAEPEPEPAPAPAAEPALAVQPAATPEPAVVVAALEPAPIRRALPQRVVPEPPTPENEPAFWIPSERVPRDIGGWRDPLPKPPRRPALALPGLVVFSLLAAFFAWVSAEPLWLAAGHGDRGTATVTRCTGNGVGQRCVGAFAATDGRFTAQPVALLGVAEHERREGAAMTARMVDRDSRQAYVGDDSLTLHLRWGLGLLLVLLCGLGIAWATGATRLETRRARRLAVLTSVAGPVLLAAGFVAATWVG